MYYTIALQLLARSNYVVNFIGMYLFSFSESLQVEGFFNLRSKKSFQICFQKLP